MPEGDARRRPATAGPTRGADPIFDLALLRITVPPSERLTAVALGDSDRVRVGDDVVAIGSPVGLDQTLTRGIVSGMNRGLPETPYSVLEPLIQTDASINPGSSGGPLLNRCGEVIGINTAVIADARNIGFAVPANLARTTMVSLLAHGRVIRPWLGFHGCRRTSRKAARSCGGPTARAGPAAADPTARQRVSGVTALDTAVAGTLA